MKTIICKFNLFDINQTIQILDSETNDIVVSQTCTIDNISDMLIHQYYQYSCNDIVLMGDSSYITERIVPRVLEVNELQYNNQQELNIKVVTTI